MSMLKAVYGLALRPTEGLVGSVMGLLGVEVPVPDHTTFSRRRRALDVGLPHRAGGEPQHLVVDATGVKLYGEGEWKVRQHGTAKRRTWRKLPLGVDEASPAITAAVVSTTELSAGQVLPDRLDQVEGALAQVSGDRTYDSERGYEAHRGLGAYATIPPPARGAPLAPRQFERSTFDARRKRARDSRSWASAVEHDSGYHRRSLAETVLFRWKTLFGGRLRERLFEAQGTERLVRCAVLNRMPHLGMPDSYAV